MLGKLTSLANLRLIDPVRYLEFVRLMKESRFVLTDSGGIQEETTALEVPSLTMRENTERPVRVALCTNTLFRKDKRQIDRCITKVLCANFKRGTVPALYDGRPSQRIAGVIVDQTVGRPTANTTNAVPCTNTQ